MEKLDFSSEYFNARDTLECGQVFRFYPFDKGYLLFSENRACYIYTDGCKTVIECDDVDYFAHYFDLQTDYSRIYSAAVEYGNEYLETAAKAGRGIRILNQSKEETLFSFILSQNNNIPRIKTMIKRVSGGLGKKFTAFGLDCDAFPTAEELAAKPTDYYASLGFGYRAKFISETAKAICEGAFDIEAASLLSTPMLKTELLKLLGVGEKVANCVLLFGFHRTDSFPVDTWIEKVYTENFGGSPLPRDKITAYFEGQFGTNSGYFQQYLFHFKRNFQ